jgi:LacI family transcriptional regulator
MRKPVTIADVARAAGVSKVAASAVVNRSRTSARVSVATRERVLAAARDLRYVPNVAAQSLTRPGMNMFGVAFNRPEFTFSSNPYVVSVLEGVLEAATHADFNVTLFSKPWVDAAHSIGPYSNGRTDGLIIIAPVLGSDMISELSALGLPLVLVSGPAGIGNVTMVNMDNVRAGEMAAQHLFDLGHRHIGFVSSGDEDTIADARDRSDGFLGRLAALGAPVPGDLIAPGSFNPHDGYDAALQILNRPDPPTAIFAANDYSAMGTLRAAASLGISVPESLSVLGFDDVPEARTTTPPLTTIRNPSVAMGKQAADLLIAQIAGEPAAPKIHLYPPELVIRESAAAPPPINR